MDAAEQRWRAGELVPTRANPEPNYENETTLTADQDISLSETLTENNVNIGEDADLTFTIDESNDSRAAGNTAANDSGFDGNDSKQAESLIEDYVPEVNESGDGDEVFEDCIDDENDDNTLKPPEKDDDHLKPNFDRVDENYSLEMKLALGIDDKKGQVYNKPVTTPRTPLTNYKLPITGWAVAGVRIVMFLQVQKNSVVCCYNNVCVSDDFYFKLFLVHE